MSLVKDIPLLIGMALILGGVVYAGSQADLPGIGGFDNPVDTIISDGSGNSFDVTYQYDVSSTLLGDTSVSGFAYQTQSSCNYCLNVVGDQLSLGGATKIRSSVTITSKESGRVVYSATHSIEEVPGGESFTVDGEVTNIEEGEYVVDTKTTYNPKYFDATDIDNTKFKSYSITVPKVDR